MGGGWWGGGDKTVAVVGLCFLKTQAREAVGAKKPKPSCWSSVWGALLKTAAGDDGRRWWGSEYKATAVVGQHIHETRAREAVGAKKLKPSCWSSVWGALLKT